jgi:hypothetical protein
MLSQAVPPEAAACFTARPWPQDPQNFAAEGLSAWHSGHFMTLSPLS